MKWSHLPEAGGLYNQHPLLLDRFRYIFSKQAEHDEQERKKQEQQNKQRTRNPTRGGRRR